MQFTSYFILDFLCKAINTIIMKNLIFSEPFEGLFTQGMVCHETYKDQKE